MSTTCWAYSAQDVTCFPECYTQVEESIEDKLSKETVGLVTFEELRAVIPMCANVCVNIYTVYVRMCENVHTSIKSEYTCIGTCTYTYIDALLCRRICF